MKCLKKVLHCNNDFSGQIGKLLFFIDYAHYNFRHLESLKPAYQQPVLQ